MFPHTAQTSPSRQRSSRASTHVGLLTAGLLVAATSPATATPTSDDHDPGSDIGAIVAHRHQQMSEHNVSTRTDRHAPGSAARPVVRTGSRATTFTHFAAPDEFAAVDTGDKGDSVGDLTAFTDLVIDRADRPIGHSAVACTRTSPQRGESQCTGTVVLDGRGSIALQGIITDADAAPLEIAVVGGTDMFEGASGTLTVTARPSDPEGLRLDFRLLR